MLRFTKKYRAMIMSYYLPILSSKLNNAELNQCNSFQRKRGIEKENR